ncbi:MAG TPA: amidohydrolase family protein [Candidatus Acidoferrales bacterium]|nr:amidohydrolase family protein [Candidatus Acidoferrales bacterium]
MLDFPLISVDEHVNEHPAAWERAQREFGDRAPHVVENPPGLGKGLWIIADSLPPVQSGYFALGHIVEKPEGITHMSVMEDRIKFRDMIRRFNEDFRYEDYPAGWDPAARLKDMDRDHIEAGVFFSSPTRYNYSQNDAKLQRSIFRSYNAWLLEFCSYNPKRLIPMPLISILDIALAVADMKEYANAGCRAVQLPATISGSGYYEDCYEPLWATAEDLGLVVAIHSGTGQGQKRKRVEGPREGDVRARVIDMSRPLPAVSFISNLIFSGVFDRYPKLRVVCTEFDAGWVAAMIERLDYAFGRESTYDPERNINKLNPSEYIRNNVFFSIEDDRAGALTTPIYGEDNFLFGTDYPHHVTTFPYSREVLERNCQGLRAEVIRKLGRENAIRAYNLAL